MRAIYLVTHCVLSLHTLTWFLTFLNVHVYSFIYSNVLPAQIQGTLNGLQSYKIHKKQIKYQTKQTAQTKTIVQTTQIEQKSFTKIQGCINATTPVLRSFWELCRTLGEGVYLLGRCCSRNRGPQLRRHASLVP